MPINRPKNIKINKIERKNFSKVYRRFPLRKRIILTPKLFKFNKALFKTKYYKKAYNSINRSSLIKDFNIPEYYDLPLHYNHTVIKLLFQNPHTLFVYWNISESDYTRFLNQYGEYLFSDTKPILIVHNVTKNYKFEVEINDYAHSWYIHVNDAKCEYSVELGRRQLSYRNCLNLPNDYLFITSSNQIEIPNNKVLVNTLKGPVCYKNIKTNQLTYKHIDSLESFKNITGISAYTSDISNDEYDSNLFDVLQNSSSTFK